MIRIDQGEQKKWVVLRLGDPNDLASMRTEMAALRFASDHGVPVPSAIAANLENEPPLLLTDAATGTSSIPTQTPTARLNTLGKLASQIHRVPAPQGADLPARERPIPGIDFAALRHRGAPIPLLVRAEKAIADYEFEPTHGLVHGDLWQGNVLWKGDLLISVVDWDCAGSGPAGIDLGSLRCDAAICFDTPAADEVLSGWESDAGRHADDVAYWDIVAGLCTPPDMAWFADAIREQGRDDLTPTALVSRRDTFIAGALDRFGR
jgi:aminoglycoside phosphotransferase (APT) family kinase protein